MTLAIRPGFVRGASLSLAVVAGAALPCAAQPTAAPAAPEPSPSPTPEAPGVQVGGFVDVYYGYNFNEVDPILRTYDVQHNAFSLSAAEVNLAKVPTAESRLGFRTDLWFGKAADLTALFEPEDDGKEIYKHVQQAYVSLLTGKVQWDAGKFVTPMGAEVIESQDNWNYSRSILFGYAIPFYHVGLRASLPVNDKLSLGAQLVNGWNNASEINGNKTTHLSATVKPTAAFTWIGNYMVGKETVDSDDNRHLFDTTLTVAATSKLSLMGNFDYGKEGGVEWWGIAAYAKVQVAPSWAVAGRYEYLDDAEGGFMTIGTKAQSITVTSDHTIAGGLRARVEYRTDFADEDIFDDDAGESKGSQTTLTVGVVYSFGGSI
ncbi:MAG TPA: porin [Vicinamibacteria bacterium]|nr:porin [Vicinamibacteria bacterium]